MLDEQKCVCLIGMAASGKTTIGRHLAHALDWAHVDTDTLIESVYGAPLQSISENMSKEEFLEIEAEYITALRLKRSVISTGGSAVYLQKAVNALKKLGPVVYINVALPTIIERIARNPNRGLAIAPGQTIEDLYQERARLYEKAADYVCDGGDLAANLYAQKIYTYLAGLTS